LVSSEKKSQPSHRTAEGFAQSAEEGGRETLREVGEVFDGINGITEFTKVKNPGPLRFRSASAGQRQFKSLFVFLTQNAVGLAQQGKPFFWAVSLKSWT